MKSFNVENVTFGDGNLVFILGPCAVESLEHAPKMAGSIKEICKRVGVQFVYKSSFDKASYDFAFDSFAMVYKISLLKFPIPIV